MTRHPPGRTMIAVLLLSLMGLAFAGGEFSLGELEVSAGQATVSGDDFEATVIVHPQEAQNAAGGDFFIGAAPDQLIFANGFEENGS